MTSDNTTVSYAPPAGAVIRLSDLIVRIAASFCRLHDQEGLVRAGHNGPYFHPQTPLRNAGHWLILLAAAHRFSARPIFKAKIHFLGDYLLSSAARPQGFNFDHRFDSFDRCNGLIGAAWTFEALNAASECLGDDRFIYLAEDVYFQHRFEPHYGLWHVLEVDGNVLPMDGTFNHQLWFAAAAGLLHGPRRDLILRDIIRFIDQVPVNMTASDEGLIEHPVVRLRSVMRHRLAGIIKHIRKGTWRRRLGGSGTSLHYSHGNNAQIKRIGYHAFNTHALGMLRCQMPAHPFWGSALCRRVVNYVMSEDYVRGLEHPENVYGYGYNPPGFEVPVTLAMFELMYGETLNKACQTWVQRQIDRTYDRNAELFQLNTDDPATLAARAYELTRLPDQLLQTVEVRV